MGTGHSKNAPDDQMRMKMENGFDDDDVDIDTLGMTERERTVRSKSNVSFHTSERLQSTEGDEYFNKIYNKRADKSLSSLSSAPIGVKSAPPASKMEKDPEVAAAIAELEETFKVLGDSTVPDEGVVKVSTSFTNNGLDEHGNSESLSLDDEYSPSSPSQTDGSTRELSNSEESGMDSASESSPCQLQYDRHLITRAGESRNGMLIDQSGVPRRSSKLLDSTRAIGTNGGYGNLLYSSCGSSRGSSDQRNMIITGNSGLKTVQGSSNIPNSVLMQQRKDFQRLQAADNVNLRYNLPGKTNEESDSATQLQDWTYEPPKIEGFDIEKFKKINSKLSTKTVPIILREDDDKGYYSRSPEIPAYTKDELELIASLEREVY